MNFDLNASLEVLARTPPALHALLSGLETRWTLPNEGADTFSPFDVVGHLIDGEETDWITRARIVLAKGPDITFERYDRFRHRERNVGRSLDSLLDEFSRLRTANLALVQSWQLQQADLDLPGLHPVLGSVTLSQLLAAWVVHDLGHIAQISRVMAKQYRDATGPWVRFLPVLTDHEQPRS